MTLFDGTQPTFRQSPPRRLRSTSATFAPSPAAPAALTKPAVPPPMTTILYFPAGVGLLQRGGWQLSIKRRSWTSSASSISS